MSGKIKITVIGAGHGGKAMAVHLAMMEFPTTLFNRTPENVAAIKELGGIHLESYEAGPRGFFKLVKVTSNMAEALEKAEMIMVGEPEGPAGKALVHPLNVATDARSNTIILSGQEESIKLAERIVQDLDRQLDRFTTEVKLFPAQTRLRHPRGASPPIGPCRRPGRPRHGGRSPALDPERRFVQLGVVGVRRFDPNIPWPQCFLKGQIVDC